ncbi:AzlD domain-containing protein [Clostridium massiliamazoniense]|uniref:AzlD domain-containing protein n=1 Tax=Clostridium massiliamazoniense TaxID=1347366 RepID=UPI0006D7ECD5|nr:AzlD domain-containing protein [Clostridium massiliamazoniense]
MYLMISLIILAVVTYILRGVPLIINKQIESNYIKSVLYYMPYCVLGVMTFPSVIYSTSNVVFSVIGAIVGIILAYKGKSLIKVAMASVVVIYLLNILSEIY